MGNYDRYNDLYWDYVTTLVEEGKLTEYKDKDRKDKILIIIGDKWYESNMSEEEEYKNMIHLHNICKLSNE